MPKWLATFCPGRSRWSLGVLASIPGRVRPAALSAPPICRQSLLIALMALLSLPMAAQTRVAVTYPAALSPQPLNGRVFLYIARPEPAGLAQRRFRRGPAEPRFAIGDQVGSQQFFGKDVLAWKAGEAVTMDAAVY